MITPIVHDAVALSMAVSSSPNKHQRIQNAYRIKIIERVWHNSYNNARNNNTQKDNGVQPNSKFIGGNSNTPLSSNNSNISSYPAVGIIEILLRPNLTQIVATLNLNMIQKLTVDENVPRKKQNRTNRKRSSTSSFKQNIEMVFNKV